MIRHAIVLGAMVLLPVSLPHDGWPQGAAAEAAGKAALKDLEQGRALSVKGDFDGAIRHLTAAVAKDPNNGEAHFLLGFSYSRKGRTADALKQTRLAVKLSPNDANARFNLAFFLQTTGKKDEAVQLYKQTLKLVPNHAGAHFNLGIILTERNDPSGPFHCRKAAALSPSLAGPICRQ